MNASTPSRTAAESFPVIDRHCWLNHAAISPWPRAVADAVGDFVAANAERGPLDYADWLAVEAELRRRAARLLGAASDDDIALVANTSTGLNAVAAGLDWRPGDSVVFPAADFPSNRLPWQQLERHGVIPRGVPLDAADPERSLIAALSPSTRLLAVSSVFYDTGLHLDLERLGAACARHGALLCVDAIQHLGALPLDVAAIGADFVVAGSHKWMLAPEGIALFWSRPEARSLLTAAAPGWRMFPDPFNFEREDWTPPDSARRFEPGTLNNVAIHGLNAALGLLHDQGADAIGQAVRARSACLTEGLLRLPGVAVTSPLKPERQAGIVTFRAASVDSQALLKRLSERGIHAARRGRQIRLSPHFYTPFAQLEDALAAISRLIP